MTIVPKLSSEAKAEDVSLLSSRLTAAFLLTTLSTAMVLPLSFQPSDARHEVRPVESADETRSLETILKLAQNSLRKKNFQECFYLVQAGKRLIRNSPERSRHWRSGVEFHKLASAVALEADNGKLAKQEVRQALHESITHKADMQTMLGCYLQAASLAIEISDGDEIRQEIQTALDDLKISPDSGPRLYLEAKLAQAAGRHDKRSALLKRITADNQLEENIERVWNIGVKQVRLELSEALLENGQVDEALKLLDSLTMPAPSTSRKYEEAQKRFIAQVSAQKAEAFLYRGDFQEAIKFAEETIRLQDPNTSSELVNFKMKRSELCSYDTDKSVKHTNRMAPEGDEARQNCFHGGSLSTVDSSVANTRPDSSDQESTNTFVSNGSMLTAFSSSVFENRFDSSLETAKIVLALLEDPETKSEKVELCLQDLKFAINTRNTSHRLESALSGGPSKKPPADETKGKQIAGSPFDCLTPEGLLKTKRLEGALDQFVRELRRDTGLSPRLLALGLERIARLELTRLRKERPFVVPDIRTNAPEQSKEAVTALHLACRLREHLDGKSQDAQDLETLIKDQLTAIELLLRVHEPEKASEWLDYLMTSDTTGDETFEQLRNFYTGWLSSQQSHLVWSSNNLEKFRIYVLKEQADDSDKGRVENQLDALFTQSSIIMASNKARSGQFEEASTLLKGIKDKLERNRGNIANQAEITDLLIYVSIQSNQIKDSIEFLKKQIEITGDNNFYLTQTAITQYCDSRMFEQGLRFAKEKIKTIDERVSQHSCMPDSALVESYRPCDSASELLKTKTRMLISQAIMEEMSGLQESSCQSLKEALQCMSTAQAGLNGSSSEYDGIAGTICTKLFSQLQRSPRDEYLSLTRRHGAWRWIGKDKKINYRISHSPSTHYEDRSRLRKLVQECLQSWESVLEGRIEFRETNDDDKAALSISFSDELNEFASGHTCHRSKHRCSLESFDKKEKKFEGSKAFIQLARDGRFGWSSSFTGNIFSWGQERRPLSSLERFSLKTTVLHEIGHALGLTHSDSASDVMYFSSRYSKGLSPRDVRSIRILYGLGKNPSKKNVRLLTDKSRNSN